MNHFGALVLPVGAALLLIGPPTLSAQELASSSTYVHERDAPVAQAIRTTAPITIDGILDEEVWMTPPAITDFTQTVPNEGQPVTERTEVRFLYDDDNIYVGAWLWDEGQILTRLARRDAPVADADFFIVLFDSYHDHNTAYRFATSPSAMKRDEIVSGGGDRTFGDTSWDPIWDIQTSITDEGWFVEMRIPFSQLRYSSAEVQTWGLQVERKIRRHGEDTVWAFTPRRERGGIPRFGHLTGIEGIAQGKRLELLPYLGGRAEYTRVARNDGVAFENPFRSGADYFGNAGIDLKYRLTPNLTLDGTLNPDFGQVEVDPAVINLSAFETRYDEKRPFFVEGGEIFDFSGSQLIYSRRIGRSPQGSVPGSAAYSDAPGAATILGALKLTGKTPSGWSMGAVNAVTGRETASYITLDGERNDAVVEPLTNYFAGRVRRDFNDGATAIGAIGTAVNRDLADAALGARLRSAAYTTGLDARADVANRVWTIEGSLAGSLINGDSDAISLAQRTSARYFDRPDAEHLDFDPAATSMAGMFGRASLEKKAGDWRGGAELTATSPGYEINDLGFQSAADRVAFEGELGFNQTVPGSTFRNWSAEVTGTSSWNFGRERQSLELGFSVEADLLSFHGFEVEVQRQVESWDDRLTRGGPLAVAPAGYSGRIEIDTDSRRPVRVRSNFNFSGDDAGGWRRSVGLNASIRFREIYQIEIGPDFERQHNAAQYVTSVADAFATSTFGRRYIFAPLDQTTVKLQTRFNTTFTPNLSFELYAEPLLSSANYDTFMELAAPRTFDFRSYGADVGSIEPSADGRVTIDPDGASGPAEAFTIAARDFNQLTLNGNAVLRWEWRPGSTLFLVWQQTRDERLTPIGDTQGRRIGHFDLNRDARALFGVNPTNVLLVKINYWMNP